MSIATSEITAVDMQTTGICRADAATVGDDEVRAKVRRLLSSLYPRGHMIERRGEQRFPFPHLLHLTPVTADGAVHLDDTVVVVGKHLSAHGLGFFHQHPLPNRRMIVSIELGPETHLGILIDLTWCRFTKHGWYESGGRFLRLVKSPLDMQA